MDDPGHTNAHSDPPRLEWNPLLSDSAVGWGGLLEAMGVPVLLLIIEERMGSRLRRRMSPEDVLQEALFHAWRSRQQLEWRGLRAFRSWFLTVVDHRIHDLADFEGTLKRGGNETIRALGSAYEGSSSVIEVEIHASTTPSRLACHREQADRMRAALSALGPRHRQVVKLRIFEDLTVRETATSLGLGESTVKHRLRRGLEEYRRHLESRQT